MHRIVSAISVILLAVQVSAAEPASTHKPNIVLIVADDLGYGDLGCFGCKDIPTPNIDGLARDGVKFTQAYAYNVCSPTRASLMTGRYAERTGIKGALMGKSVSRFAQETTVATMLHGAGYVTGLVGKWHLGYEGDVVPTRMGFDEFFGFRGGKIDYFKHTDSTQKNDTPEGKHDLYEGTTEIVRDGYSTDLFTERAQRFIREHAAQPFFLEIAYNAPHYASHAGDYEAPEAYLKRFGVEAGNAKGTRGGYAAMVSCMDDGIGRVLAELKAQKLEERTLVIFISDNGAEGAGSNRPLSGGKHTNKEGGIRLPWTARWLGVIPPGTVRKDVVHVMDLTPTMVALAHALPPAGVHFDGTNIWSAFINQDPLPERAICFGDKAVRQGQWKLNDGQLFNLEADVGETTNVSATHPDVCERLSKQLNTIWQGMK